MLRAYSGPAELRGSRGRGRNAATLSLPTPSGPPLLLDNSTIRLCLALFGRTPLGTAVLLYVCTVLNAWAFPYALPGIAAPTSTIRLISHCACSFWFYLCPKARSIARISQEEIVYNSATLVVCPVVAIIQW